ncbi:MAG: NAD(P)/FAD-dependent oxidoreductase [Bacillota bacterium]|nr:NAD(P)/FAD-dependent oxidoreductase [Bacillota bacterium]
MYDVAVIGAGVIGTAIARELSKFNASIVILEKCNDVSTGTTKANSAIIHAGYDAPFDTLKGKMNVKGNEMYDKVCDELSVPFRRIGSLVIAHNKKEMKTIQELFDNGINLGVPDLELLDSKKVLKMEPNLNKDIIAALYAPTAGVLEPWELAIAYCENAIDNGAELKLNFEVKKIKKENDTFIIKSDSDEIQTKHIINAAGVYSDSIYKMVTEADFEIHPRRGQYFLLDKAAGNLVNHIIFPCPTKMGKGTLITPTIEGNIIIGPDSEDLTVGEKESTNTTINRLNHIKNLAENICVNIPYNLNITTFAGLRAEPTDGDFIIEASDKVSGFINVAGIKSPGLSSAPAIAEYVINIFKKLNPEMNVNKDFNPLRDPRIKFKELSNIEKDKLIKKDPRYGNIVCRCETITEGEIVDTIHRNAGARTVNGIKRRVRPGAGRCQGGFCGPKVIEILARELNIPLESVALENLGSEILIGKTKGGVHNDKL